MKTEEQIREMEEVIKEGGEINHEQEALSLLEFEKLESKLNGLDIAEKKR